MALTRINNQALTNVTRDGLPSITSSDMPSGSVIAVKSAKDTTQYTASGTGNHASGTEMTGLSVSITPQSSSSKFYITFSGSGMIYGTSSQDHGVIIKGGTSGTTELFRVNGYKADNTWDSANFGGSILTSPNSTATQVYKVFYYRDGGNSQDMRINRSGGDCSLTVMEIAG